MISKILTPLGSLVYTFYAVIACLFVMGLIDHGKSSDDPLLQVLVVVAVVGAPLVMVIRIYRMRQQIKQRAAALANLGKELSAKYEAGSEAELSSNFTALKLRDPYMFNTLEGPDWRYNDFRHAVYRRAKNGEYKAADVYYSVLVLELERGLPTMLFDSPKTHHKQFKKFFDKSQVHQLEGNFDQHFTTYFPKYYSIDALSIITPEVMQAMIAADQFDIEIDGNKLYLYGPLVPVGQVESMVKNGQEIRRKLMNNLVTYRDERLDAADGRKGVSVYGAGLRKNPFRDWPMLLLGLVFMVSFVLDPRHDVQVLLFAIFLMLPGAWSIWSGWRNNKRLDAEYAEHMNFLAHQKQGERSLKP